MNMSPLDVEHLSRQTFGDSVLQAELLDLFVRQATAILAALDGARGAEAPPDNALLHKLCGSARAIGFWDVATLAQRAEHRLSPAAGAAAAAEGREAVEALALAVAAACRAAADFTARPLAEDGAHREGHG